MPIELPLAWVIALNVLGWPVIHLGVAWVATRLPPGRFDPQGRLCRARPWEAEGRLYERLFGIKHWKHFLPDGAPWFRGGFAKKSLARGADPAYLARFVRETCRGEIAHWFMLAFAPVFLLWNPWWADLIMVGYGVAANVPCILTQRYNRRRLTRVLDHQMGLLPDSSGGNLPPAPRDKQRP